MRADGLSVSARLEIGKEADLALLSQDIFSVKRKKLAGPRC
jgi:predicted amidohydrolase YtcJ